MLAAVTLRFVANMPVAKASAKAVIVAPTVQITNRQLVKAANGVREISVKNRAGSVT